MRTRGYTDRTPCGREAGRRDLGISSEGIRQRIRRGTLESEKDTDGRVYVFLEGEELEDAPSERDKDEVMTRLEGEVEFLRRELATRDEEIRRRDAILLSMSEGLKALSPPAPQEPPDAPETVSEDRGGAEAPPEPEKPVSWWRRLFG